MDQPALGHDVVSHTELRNPTHLGSKTSVVDAIRLLGLFRYTGGCLSKASGWSGQNRHATYQRKPANESSNEHLYLGTGARCLRTRCQRYTTLAGARCISHEPRASFTGYLLGFLPSYIYNNGRPSFRWQSAVLIAERAAGLY